METILAKERIEKLLEYMPALMKEIKNRQINGIKNGMEISTKSSAFDFVTEVDIFCDKYLCDLIKTYFPNDNICAEESGEQIVSEDGNDFTWYIDPIDGTTNFAHGLPIYAISLGIMSNNTIMGGIVALPALGDIYTAVIGEGAFKNGIPIKSSPQKKLNLALVATGFPYQKESYMTRLIAGIDSLLKNCADIRRLGAASIDICFVAEGKLDAYYEFSLKPWDTCAGVIIAKEAGAIVSNLKKTTYHPRDEFVLVTNSHLHQDFQRILPFYE